MERRTLATLLTVVLLVTSASVAVAGGGLGTGLADNGAAADAAPSDTADAGNGSADDDAGSTGQASTTDTDEQSTTEADSADTDEQPTTEADSADTDEQSTTAANSTEASLRFDDQASTGDAVNVSSVSLPESGFVIVSNEEGELVGVSAYLPAGAHENVSVPLTEALTENATLTAAGYRDYRDDHQFSEETFFESCQYLAPDGSPLADAANVTVSDTGEPLAEVVFEDQESAGTNVTVDSVFLPDGGFVVLHDETGAVVGHSAYLGAGVHEDVPVTLDEPLNESATLTAMAHTDDGDQSYEFPGADGPYLDAGSNPVVDDANVTVGEAAVGLSEDRRAFFDSPADVAVSAFVAASDVDLSQSGTVENQSLDATLDGTTLTLGYNASALPGGTGESDLSLYRYDESAVTFERVDSTVDADADTVSGDVDGPGTYVVLPTSAWAAKFADPLPRVRPAAQNATGFDVGLVLDASGSMGGASIDIAREAAKQLNGQLQDPDRAAVVQFGMSTFDTDAYNRTVADAGGSGPYATIPGDTNTTAFLTGYYYNASWQSYVSGLGLSPFAVYLATQAEAGVVQPFTFDRDAVNASIDTLQASGGTPMDQGINATNAHFEAASNDSREQVAILLSDGVPNDPQAALDAANRSAELGIRIYTVGIGGVDDAFMQRIANITNGTYTRVQNLDDLPEVFSAVGRNATTYSDTDGDGIPNRVETAGMRVGTGEVITTDPDVSDTDGDGLTDGEEIVVSVVQSNEEGQYFTMVSDPTEADTDGDGVDDYQEYIVNRTDPLDADSA